MKKASRIFTKGSYCYTSRTVRVEGGSRIEVYSHSLIIQSYITSVILPVSPWRSVPTSICRHINVTRVLVNNHASAWEIVVYERGGGPEITTIRIISVSHLNNRHEVLLAEIFFVYYGPC